MANKNTSPFYKLLVWIVRAVYTKIDVVGWENVPDEPVIIVGNHSQMHGPVAGELYIPESHYIWCAGQMMHLKDVPAYAYQDFWSKKPKLLRPLYKLLSYIIAPLSVFIFRNAHTIGVYHDARIITTFKQTVKRLQEGANVVIFPEHDAPYDHILCQFQDRFIDVAKLYHKRTGKAIAFVPMYLAPKLKKMYFGEPIYFRPDVPMAEERGRICQHLMTHICQIARALPEHTVIPYNNIPKKQYPTNIPKEDFHAKTRS